MDLSRLFGLSTSRKIGFKPWSWNKLLNAEPKGLNLRGFVVLFRKKNFREVDEGGETLWVEEGWSDSRKIKRFEEVSIYFGEEGVI